MDLGIHLPLMQFGGERLSFGRLEQVARASYGHTTATQNQGGHTYRSVTANINGLSGSTTYHFRSVATNSAGTRYGADRSFTTR